MKWTLLDKKLFLDGRRIEMPEGRPVDKVIEHNGRLYILLDRGPRPSPTDNVVCVDPAGNILWKLKPFLFEDRDNPVTNIWIDEKKSDLRAYFWVGVEVIVDPLTGDWVPNDESARPW